MSNLEVLQTKQFEVMSGSDLLHGRYCRVDDRAPTVLMATGGSAKGSLSSSWANFTDIFSSRGLSSIVFDFAGQGRSGGDRRVLTITKGVRNLVDVLHEVLSWDWIEESRLALLGSSFGGNVVLDYLASDSALHLRGASFKSPCIDLRESYFQELGHDGMLAWQHEGYSSATGLNWEVMEDADASDLCGRLHHIRMPILITHGCADESVPIAQSRLVRDRVSGVVDLFEMKNTNHHYSDGDDWNRMAAVHAAWLTQLFANYGQLR